jgi:hypothetical protein
MDASAISNSEAAQTRSKLFMTDFLSFAADAQYFNT